MREIVSPLNGIPSPLFALRDPYAVGGYAPEYVLDLKSGRYRAGGLPVAFDAAALFETNGLRTMVDRDGVRKWGAHNLLLWSEDFSQTVWNKQAAGVGLAPTVTANAGLSPFGELTADRLQCDLNGGTTTGDFSWVIQTVSAGFDTRGGVWVKSFDGNEYTIVVSNSGLRSEILVTNNWQLVYTPKLNPVPAVSLRVGLRGYSGVSDTCDILIWGAHLYRSDLGGMVNNPATGNTYVPTDASAVYLPRIGHHVYEGGRWVNIGMLKEPTRTNIFLNSLTPATQTITVASGTTYTLSVVGGGSAVLSGAGTGTATDGSHVTFTAGTTSATVTITGTPDHVQLEAGSTPTSPIPTGASSYTRAIETLKGEAGVVPWNHDGVSLNIKGRTSGENSTLIDWQVDASNYIRIETGASDFTFSQSNGGTVGSVTGGSYTSGTGVPFNVASYHQIGAVNGAVSGVTLTADTTAGTLPDASGADVLFASDFNGTIELIRIWGRDIGDTNIGRAAA